MAVEAEAKNEQVGGGLRRELQFWEAIALSLAIMAPTAAMALNGVGVSALIGRAVPLAFIFATIAVIFVSYAFWRLSAHFSHAGSVYAFTGVTLGPQAGFFAGWALFGTYLAFTPSFACCRRRLGSTPSDRNAARRRRGLPTGGVMATRPDLRPGPLGPYDRQRRWRFASRLAVVVIGGVASLGWAPASHAGSGSSHPRIRWSTPTLIDPPVGSQNANLNDISCASKSLCVAVDQFGDAVASTDPLARTWRVTSADPGVALSAVSCPSGSFCAASGGNDLVVSTDPGAAAPTWTIESFDPEAELLGVSCPSKSLCVAVDDRHHILTSTDPAGGPSAWTSVTIARKFDLAAVTCPSTVLCAISGLAFGSGGYEVTSKDPTVGRWKVYRGAGPTTCASNSFCAGVSETTARVSTNPTGGPTSFTSRKIKGGPRFDNGHHLFYDVSCPSKSLCVAAGGYGYLARSYSPLHRPSTWRPHYVKGLAPGDRGFFYSVACPSTSLCVAGDRAGYVTVGRG